MFSLTGDNVLARWYHIEQSTTSVNACFSGEL